MVNKWLEMYKYNPPFFFSLRNYALITASCLYPLSEKEPNL